MTYRAAGVVEQITAIRPGIQELLVRLEAGTRVASPVDAVRPAMNLTELTGHVAPGDRVEVNTVAMDLNLGTGGFDFVVSVSSRSTGAVQANGHIVKLRYTPLQTPVLAVESQESCHHQTIARFVGLADTPVVCFELHSQLPAICAALHWALKECGLTARVAYIMTDGAALPIAISRIVTALKERGMITATITAGQAVGGDYEAVNIYSAMAAARDVVEADVIVIGQGPGNVGTDTPLGFSGVDQGMAVNAAASLGGVPVFVPRISFADSRSRHVGLSHHSVTNLTSVVRAPVLVPIPRLPRDELTCLYEVMQEKGILDVHEAITIDADLGLQALEGCGLNVTTMGRGIDKERAFFLAAAAAGLLAAQLVESRVNQPEVGT